MCLICIEYQKGGMTFDEAFRALGEMAVGLGPEHTEEVKGILIQSIHEEYERLRDAIQDTQLSQDDTATD
jgi:hypothetical protein